ncbi:MAG: hypothetical protein GC180_12300 [Bacteroidetes bacterium]|nr:hypothetical protein [Bacteroidota bacterium]
MKRIFFLSFFFYSFLLSNGMNALNANEKIAGIDFSLIYRTWRVREVTLKYGDEVEEESVNGETMTFQKDMTVLLSDSENNGKAEKLKWEIVKPNQIKIETDDLPMVFTVTKLTQTELILLAKVEEAEVKMTLNSSP